MPVHNPATYTISQVAERWNCSTDHVLRLVHGGVLPAFDVSIPCARRAKWLVRHEDLEAFEDSRQKHPPEISSPTAKRAIRQRKRLDRRAAQYIK